MPNACELGNLTKSREVCDDGRAGPNVPKVCELGNQTRAKIDLLWGQSWVECARGV